MNHLFWTIRHEWREFWRTIGDGFWLTFADILWQFQSLRERYYVYLEDQWSKAENAESFSEWIRHEWRWLK